MVRADDLAVLGDHAQQDLEVRRAGVAAERHDQLRVELEAVLVDGAAELADQIDVGEAADDAFVGIVIDLDAVAAAVVGGLAGGLGGGEGMHEFLGAHLDGRHADADRDLHLAVAERAGDFFGAGAQRLGELCGILQRRGQHDRKAVAGNARRAGARWQAFADQLAELRDHAIAHRHAVIVVDDMQAVDVDEQRAPGRRCRIRRARATRHDRPLLERTAYTLLEGGACQQAGQRIVAVRQYRGHAPRQQLDQARMMRRELGRGFGAKQCQHTDAAPIGA